MLAQSLDQPRISVHHGAMSEETPDSLIPYDEIVQEALRAVVGPSVPLANIRSSAVVLGGLAGLVLLAAVAQPLLDEASRIPSASTTFSSMPAYWLFGMALSAAIVAAHLSLLAHDIALLARRRLFGEAIAEPVEA